MLAHGGGGVKEYGDGSNCYASDGSAKRSKKQTKDPGRAIDAALLSQETNGAISWLTSCSLLSPPREEPRPKPQPISGHDIRGLSQFCRKPRSRLSLCQNLML